MRENLDFLKSVIAEFKNAGIRTSIFLDPNPEMVKFAAETGTDRIELYTEAYAKNYETDKEAAIKPYYETAVEATKYGLGINAGHDLSLDNLKYFADNIPNLLEVSIGHALISEALYLGLENTIQAYLKDCEMVKSIENLRIENFKSAEKSAKIYTFFCCQKNCILKFN